MNFNTQESRCGELTRGWWALIIFFIVLPPPASTAQECTKIVYLESQTVKAGEQATIVAAEINGPPGKEIIIEKEGQLVLQAAGRIELNSGFRALTGSWVVAEMKSCDPGEPNSDPAVVFPNPTDGILNIKAPYKIGGLRLTDMSGFVQLEKTGINDFVADLDLSHLKPGYYILEIIADGSVAEAVRIEKK